MRPHTGGRPWAVVNFKININWTINHHQRAIVLWLIINTVSTIRDYEAITMWHAYDHSLGKSSTINHQQSPKESAKNNCDCSHGDKLLDRVDVWSLRSFTRPLTPETKISKHTGTWTLGTVKPSACESESCVLYIIPSCVPRNVFPINLVSGIRFVSSWCFSINTMKLFNWSIRFYLTESLSRTLSSNSMWLGLIKIKNKFIITLINSRPMDKCKRRDKYESLKHLQSCRAWVVERAVLINRFTTIIPIRFSISRDGLFGRRLFLY